VGILGLGGDQGKTIMEMGATQHKRGHAGEKKEENSNNRAGIRSGAWGGVGPTERAKTERSL